MSIPYVQATSVDTPVKGVVYVLTNAAMPGLAKISMTTLDVVTRLKQLDQTGVPLPFECVLAVEVPDAAFVERRLHAVFGDHRIRPSREFFRVGPERVKAALELVKGIEVTPKVDVVQTPADQAALDAERIRRSNFRFSNVGIQPGAVLTSSFDEAVTCNVVDDRRVRFRDEVTSLSAAGLRVAHENGFLWKSVQGPSVWLYEGNTLDELRTEAETGDDAEAL